jgi:hypothetical protein
VAHTPVTDREIAYRDIAIPDVVCLGLPIPQILRWAATYLLTFSTVAHTLLTDREIMYQDIMIPVALIHETLQVPNPDVRESRSLHVPSFLSLYRTSQDHDSCDPDFFISKVCDVLNPDSSLDA